MAAALFFTALTMAHAQGAPSWFITGAGSHYLKPVTNLLGLQVPGLATSTTGCLAVTSSGWVFANGSACGSGSGGTFSFTPTANFGTAVNSTSTPIWFTQGLMASSTIYGQFFDTDKFSGYKQNGAMLLMGSTTSGLTLGGLSAGAALTATTSVNGNTAFGDSALLISTSSRFMTAIGYQALSSVDDYTTQRDTAVGYQAGKAITTGTQTTAIGASALAANTTGPSNTAVGFSALSSLTTGFQNVAIGSGAGLSVTSSNNVLIGMQVASSLTSGGTNIIIGASVDAQAANSANTLNIANILFGTNNSATSKTYSTGQIGIGSTSPFARLAINGNNGDTNTILFAIGSSTATATTTLFKIDNTGSSTLLGVASSTGLIVSGLNAASCDVKASTSGLLSCGTDATGAGGSGNVATSTAESATAVAVWSSTAATPATLGSDSNFAWSSGTLFMNSTDVNENFVLGRYNGNSRAILGYDANKHGTLNLYNGSDVNTVTLTSSGVSTLGGGGVVVNASSTIGSGTQTGGLTISGAATTTGHLLVQGSATTTNLAVTATASTSALIVSGLNAASCDVKASTSGVLSCGTDATGAGGGVWPFTPTAYGQSTTSIIALLGGFMSTGSSTVQELKIGESTTTNATSTNLAVTGTASTSALYITRLVPASLAVDITGKVYSSATTTFSTGLTYANGATTCVTGSATVFGCLPAADWLTFNGKIATGTTFSSGNLLYWGANGTVFNQSTSTLTASSPLTGSFIQVGSGGSLGCQTGSGSQAGCISSTDWNTFNNKIGWGQATSTSANQSVYTDALGKFVSIATSTATISSGLSYSGTWGSLVGGASGNLTCVTGNATTFGCLPAADWLTFNSKVATGTTFVSSNLAYFGSNGTLFNIATGTISGTNGVTVTSGRSAVGGALAVDCTVGSLTAVGCISVANSNLFNNKIGTSTAKETAGQLGYYTTTSGTPPLMAPISTTSVTCSTGVSCTGFTGLGAASVITNTYGYPWTAATTYNTASQGTTTPIWLQGSPFSLFASSTVVLTYATTTALTVTGQAAASGNNCLQIDTLGFITKTGSACGGVGSSPGGSSGQIQYNTGSTFGGAANTTFHSTGGWWSLGTSTLTSLNPALLTLGTSTVPQLLLTDNTSTNPNWYLRSVGGNFYVGTSSATTLATSSVPLFTAISSTKWGYLAGFGTSSPVEALTVVGGGILNVETAPGTTTAMTVSLASSTQQLIQIGNSATTLTLSDLYAGQSVRIIVCNPSSAAGALTWATSPANKLIWNGNTAVAPTQTTTANLCDLYLFTVTQATSTTSSAPMVFGSQVANY